MAVLTGKGEEFTPEEICAGGERERERERETETERDRERQRQREREREREGQRETRKINTCKAKG